MSTEPQKCCKEVYGRYSGCLEQCGKKAKVVRDGKPYCGIHDPGGPTGIIVYAIDDGYSDDDMPKLDSADVAKQTPSRFVLSKYSRAFGYKDSIEIKVAHRTPATAWSAYIEAQNDRIASAKRAIAKAEKALGHAIAERGKLP